MSARAPLGVGDTLPAVVLLDEAGREWHPADAHGRPLVLILHRHLA